MSKVAKIVGYTTIAAVGLVVVANVAMVVTLAGIRHENRKEMKRKAAEAAGK